MRRRQELSRSTRRGAAIVIAMMLVASTLAAADGPGWVDVGRYLPESWATDGSVDLREQIQQALDENSMVFFAGSNDSENPRVYPVTCGLEVRENAQVRFGANAWLLRLPSEGSVISLADGARMIGGVIDGNKYNHWPEFDDLGKNHPGVRIANHCVLEDVVVFNNPGIAFFSYGSYNKLYRCLAENVGYIDVKFGAMNYQGSRDRWSGDGFYFRGTGNLIRDCEAYDAKRWAFCSSHNGARQNTYVDCRGGDVNFRTYGFIDIEGAEGNNRLIRCISPNSHIAIPGSAQTEVIQCMASRISFYDHQNPESVEMYGGQRGIAPVIDGCITTEGGIVIGGWSSLRNRLIPGALSPIVTNNRMYKSHSGPSDGYSDWSFSVHSVDGSGVVSGNILFEFDDGYTRGPGMNLENIEGSSNHVVYGQNWELDLPRVRLRYGYIAEEQVEARRYEYAREMLAEKAEELGLTGEVVSLKWLPDTARFIKDTRNAGEESGWQRSIPAADAVMEMPVGTHWDFSIGRYAGVGWYYLPLELPEVAAGNELYLYVSGIDSEAKLFIDGELAGEHRGWDTPSLIRVPDELRGADRELLAVKVYTSGGMGGIYGPIGLVVARGGA
ncbi:MAG: hypothetical protein ACOX9R_18180 [Armatimonadota bacterium]